MIIDISVTSFRIFASHPWLIPNTYSQLKCSLVYLSFMNLKYDCYNHCVMQNIDMQNIKVPVNNLLERLTHPAMIYLDRRKLCLMNDSEQEIWIVHFSSCPFTEGEITVKANADWQRDFHLARFSGRGQKEHSRHFREPLHSKWCVQYPDVMLLLQLH